MLSNKRLILASKSPRRRDLLDRAGYRFRVVPAELGEPDLEHPEMAPEDMAEALAYFKARQVADDVGPGHIVLGADTIVALGHEIFGKAEDAEQARSILKKLSHNQHRVITAVVVIDTDTDRRMLDFEVTHITMKPMTAQEIDSYIASGSWKDKAGAYAIQEGADKFVTDIVGSFENVVGLPVDLIVKMLAAFDVHPE